MDELSKIAKGYYQASSDELQKLAGDFFEAMDDDRDGKIDKKEFLEFMRDQGYAQMTNPSFFNQLDLNRNGTLEFFEVMTLYYIVKSGRPFCDWCKKFITSTYLSCVGCLEDPVGGSFYLCLDCYIERKCNHTHNHMSRFLDNYSLLEAAKLRTRPSGTVPVERPSSGTYNHTLNNPSSAMVRVPNRPTRIQNHHVWNPRAPTVPIQNVAATSIHNNTWIQNNHSYHYQYPAASNAAIVPQKRVSS